MKKWAKYTLTTVFTLVLAVMLFSHIPYRMENCAEGNGPYFDLAEFDSFGFVQPFGKLNLSSRNGVRLEFFGRWDGEIKRVTITDPELIESFQKLKFYCTGGDMATPDSGFDIFVGEEKSYDTSLFLDQGLQNREFGFLLPLNRFYFAYLTDEILSRAEGDEYGY